MEQLRSIRMAQVAEVVREYAAGWVLVSTAVFVNISDSFAGCQDAETGVAAGGELTQESLKAWRAQLASERAWWVLQRLHAVEDKQRALAGQGVSK
ncbi:MAG TPA: hypothetical protein VMW72_03080 [Sedimentisphaerales bacterium]|nr:hypothetical protein [Sedimentisphaerales bacterium]